MSTSRSVGTTESTDITVSSDAKHASLDRWQNRLQPVMVGILISLAAFFFIATMIQMAYLQRFSSDIPPVVLPTAVTQEQALEQSDPYASMPERQFELLTAMEAYLAQRRYHQASVLIMSGLWIRYLGFVTGMVLAFVGASFILGKLEGSPSELEGQGAGMEGSLRTASPGIVLVVLGSVLMLATIINRDEYGTQDGAIYLPSWAEPDVSQNTSATVPTVPIPVSTPDG